MAARLLGGSAASAFTYSIQEVAHMRAVRQHLRRHSLEGLSVIRGRKVTRGFLKAGFGVTPLSLLIDPCGMPKYGTLRQLLMA